MIQNLLKDIELEQNVTADKVNQVIDFIEELAPKVLARTPSVTTYEDENVNSIIYIDETTFKLMHHFSEDDVSEDKVVRGMNKKDRIGMADKIVKLAQNLISDEKTKNESIRDMCDSLDYALSAIYPKSSEVRKVALEHPILKNGEAILNGYHVSKVNILRGSDSSNEWFLDQKMEIKVNDNGITSNSMVCAVDGEYRTRGEMVTEILLEGEDGGSKTISISHHKGSIFLDID